LRFFRQLEALPIEPLWRQVRPSLYALQGALDWVVAEGDNERIASWVSDAGEDACARTFPGVDHDMQHHPNRAASYLRRGSAPFAPEVAAESIVWMQARC
jgi:hypothetical protein